MLPLTAGQGVRRGSSIADPLGPTNIGCQVLDTLADVLAGWFHHRVLAPGCHMAGSGCVVGAWPDGQRRAKSSPSAGNGYRGSESEMPF
jgi:hypothetical protein